MLMNKDSVNIGERTLQKEEAGKFSEEFHSS